MSNKAKTLAAPTPPTTQAPASPTAPSDASTTAPTGKKKRAHTLSQLVLVEITEDVHTHQQVLAIVDTPPLPAGKPITTAAIEAACERAVYEDGKKEFGNKQFAVVAIRKKFQISYVERPALIKPKQ